MMSFLLNMLLKIMIDLNIFLIFLDHMVLLFSKNKNYLFVDGRYTLQALKQSGKLFNIITFPNKMPNDILKIKNLK